MVLLQLELWACFLLLFAPQASVRHGNSGWQRLRRACDACFQDPYDPHDPPKSGHGPWFEGWYTRATLDNGASLAFAIGAFQHSHRMSDIPPAEEQDVFPTSHRPPGSGASRAQPAPINDSAVCFLIVDSGDGQQPFYSALGHASVDASRITDPDHPQERPNFLVTATATQQQRLEVTGVAEPAPGLASAALGAGRGQRGASIPGTCRYAVNSSSVTFDIYVPGVVSLTVTSHHTPSASLPWGPSPQSSPEGWLSDALRLHYHVHSLATPAHVKLQWLGPQGTGHQEQRQEQEQGQGQGQRQEQGQEQEQRQEAQDDRQEPSESEGRGAREQHQWGASGQGSLRGQQVSRPLHVSHVKPHSQSQGQGQSQGQSSGQGQSQSQGQDQGRGQSQGKGQGMDGQQVLQSARRHLSTAAHNLEGRVEGAWQGLRRVQSRQTPSAWGLPPLGAEGLDGPALLHMEKNWGRAFPTRWVWAQGHSSTAQSQAVSFVLAGGAVPTPLSHLLPEVRQYVFSMRSICTAPSHKPGRDGAPNPAAGGSGDGAGGLWDDERLATYKDRVRSRVGRNCTPVDVQIDPFNPAVWFQEQFDSCAGLLHLKLFSATHIVKVTVRAPVKTFVLLPCPMPGGAFQPGSVESFQGVANIQVLQRSFPFAEESGSSQVADVTVHGVAVEFGGGYMCSEGRR